MPVLSKVSGPPPLQPPQLLDPPPVKDLKVFGPCRHVSVDEAEGRSTFEIFEQVQRKKEAT
jgi:hypothetical protein